MKRKKNKSRKTKNDFLSADSFLALCELAVKRLQGSHDLHMVCGPITTGGTGNPALNFAVLKAVIFGLKKEEKKVFDQTPYEYGLRLLAEKWRAEGNNGYCLPVLEVFFNRIFDEGFIAEGWFISGWESSLGTRWERQKIITQKGIVHDLSSFEICKYIKMAYSKKKAKYIIKHLTVS